MSPPPVIGPSTCKPKNSSSFKSPDAAPPVACIEMSSILSGAYDIVQRFEA